MRIKCPNCGQFLKAPDDAAGKKARCLGCNTSFVISGSGPEMVVKPCPHCGAELDELAVMCHACGYNFHTGQVPPPPPAPTVFEPPPPEEPPSFLFQAVQVVAEYLPGLFRPKILVLSIIVTLVALVFLGFCAFLAALGALIEAGMVGAPGLILYGQAIAMMLAGETGYLQELLPELDGRRWLIFFVLLLSPWISLYYVARAYVAH